MGNPDYRSGSNLTRSHLRIYRRIADGTKGAFMAPADVRDLLDEIDRLEAERDVWKRVAEGTGVCMTCALGAPDISIGCTDCLNTGWAHGAPEGFVREKMLDDARAEGRRAGIEEMARNWSFRTDRRAQAAVLADLPVSVAREAANFYENAGGGRTILKCDAMAEAWAGVLRPYLIGLRDHSETQERPALSVEPDGTSPDPLPAAQGGR